MKMSGDDLLREIHMSDDVLLSHERYAQLREEAENWRKLKALIIDTEFAHAMDKRGITITRTGIKVVVNHAIKVCEEI